MILHLLAPGVRMGGGSSVVASSAPPQLPLVGFGQ